MFWGNIMTRMPNLLQPQGYRDSVKDSSCLKHRTNFTVFSRTSAFCLMFFRFYLHYKTIHIHFIQQYLFFFEAQCFLWLKTDTHFFAIGGWVDDEWIAVFGWTIPFKCWQWWFPPISNSLSAFHHWTKETWLSCNHNVLIRMNLAHWNSIKFNQN